MLNIRLARQRKGGPLRGGPVLGKIEEGFIESLAPGDTFLFAGKVLRFEGINENNCVVTKASDLHPKVPAYAGGKFPTTTYLSAQVRKMLSDPGCLGPAAGTGVRMARHPEGKISHSRAERIAGRDVPAQRPALHGRLSRSRAALPTRRSACC